MYHSDFRAFERFGAPLTGTPYFKLKKGPAPKALMIFRRQLEEEGAIKIAKVDIGGGREQIRTVALRDAITDHFSVDELQLVDEVIEELWNQNAAEVSNASHDIRWKVLELKDDIPYEFAYLSNEDVTSQDIARTHELAAEHGWLERYGRP
ncbi:hypothetical protein CN311_30580 [Mesorhizobium sanjuanii]|uniref:Antitoxin SocA-like Panacea domain-containing protein n=2 Tax=Mesorhizobium sanjuanii TaxID=2037900 RepID=A0A2A6F6S8_9HYPH|nr:hypothetical protein CN311_30580 [Mesorhizobium sanjuanii]